MLKRSTLRVEVADVAPPGCRTVAVEVVGPDPLSVRAEPPPVLFCFPGGGMSRKYFDLDAPGYSFAEWAALRGHVVVLVDHPGVGESDVPDDGWTLTPSTVAAVNAATTERVLDQLRAGAVPGFAAWNPPAVIGVAHSAGAGILIVQQAEHHSFAALVLLGWGARGLPEFLSEAERALADGPELTGAQLVAFARARNAEPLPLLAGGRDRRADQVDEIEPGERRAPTPVPRGRVTLIANPLPAIARAALVAAQSRLLAVAGHASMIPGSVSPAAGRVDVPVFLGVGEHDIAGPPHEIPAVFSSSPDVTVFVLAAAGHNQNVEPTRERLWARVAHWASGVLAAPERRPAQAAEPA